MSQSHVRVLLRGYMSAQVQAGLKKQGHSYAVEEMSSLLEALEDENRVLVTGETIYRI